ncbi:DNA-processing protein DprA [Oceanobacillus limi]|nr:DNA-processing protein DprA [Oceanobacillus limi]
MHLHRCRGITRKTIRHILHDDPALSHIYHLTASDIKKRYNIPLEKSTTIVQDLHHDRLYNQVVRDFSHYKVITIVDENYPPMLKTIKDAPLVLYTIGNTSLLNSQPALSVIGTRKPSKEAKGKLNHIVRPLLDDKWVIISGMARGIDSFSHQLSLHCKGKTIAVLGSGFDNIYPQENVGLFQRICEEGLVISEYPPNCPPKPYYFPERNRIISGLSFGTLVIEAMERSGTLITVDQALDQGKEVYAVPGSPLIQQTIGCHKMIQDGAKLVHHANDILEDWENSPEKRMTTIT